MLKRFFLNLKGLFDGSVVSLTKNEYGSVVHSLLILVKSLVLMSDEWFIAICRSFLLFGIFAIKKWLVFSLTSFGTLKYDCVIKTREIFNFLPLINYRSSFLLWIIPAIISSKTINILFSLSGLSKLIFLYTSCISFEYSRKTLGLLKWFMPTLSLSLI